MRAERWPETAILYGATLLTFGPTDLPFYRWQLRRSILGAMAQHLDGSIQAQISHHVVISLFGYVCAALFSAGINYAIDPDGFVKDKATASLLSSLGLIVSMAVCHITFIKSDSGSRVSRGNALTIAFFQVIGTAPILVAALLPLRLLGRVFL